MNKRNLYLVIVGILLISVIVFGITYAYLGPREGTPGITDVTIGGDSLDELTFIPGDPFVLNHGSHNLSDGMGNISSTSNPKVKLVANTTDNTAITQNYNMYFRITNNTFVYSDGSTPELILEVTKPDGTSVETIDGLTKVTHGSVTGFDITNKTGLYDIAIDYIINSTSSTDGTVHDWVFKVTIINLPIDQSINVDAYINAEVIMQENTLPLSELCQNQVISSCFIENIDSEPALIKHTPEITTSAGDNNYRYAGSNPDNWVCFGSDLVTCPEDNLYRILGIYNIDGESKVKLIKEKGIDKNNDGIYDFSSVLSLDLFEFDTGDDNRWEGANTADPSDDADINIYLNNTFYNTIPSIYQEMISEEKYNIGGVPWDTTYKPKDFYIGEIVTKTTQTYKIGLIYPSDYFYGASESYWGFFNATGIEEYNGNEEMQTNNWIFKGRREWAMVPCLSDFDGVWYLHSDGFMNFVGADVYLNMVNPVLYLKSSVSITGGSGTENEPYRLG